MKKLQVIALLLSTMIFLASCGEDDGDSGITVPDTYSFTRNGESTVSFSGQTTRILMGEEIITALKNHELSNAEASIDAMFSHEEGANDFANTSLNASGKNVRSKTAASSDFFSSNTTASAVVKADFDDWIAAQVVEVFPNWGEEAAEGKAGFIQEAGGGPNRYMNA